jgi:hypothetical protein
VRAAAIAFSALAAATACFAQEGAGVAPLDGPDLTGSIEDARTGKPPRGVLAVVQMSWTLKADSKAVQAGRDRTKKVVREVNSVAGGRFGLIDWMQHVDLKGWELVPGQDPVVRIYAPGYHRLVVENSFVAKGGKRVPVNAEGAKGWKWVGEGVVQRLRPLPGDPAAPAAELALWRRDIDADLAVTPTRDRDAAIRDREKLLLLFDQLCSSLAAPPPKLCYPADSPVGRFIAERKDLRSKYVIVKEPGGQEKRYGIQAQPAPQPLSAQPGDPSAALGYSRKQLAK